MKIVLIVSALVLEIFLLESVLCQECEVPGLIVANSTNFQKLIATEFTRALDNFSCDPETIPCTDPPFLSPITDTVSRVANKLNALYEKVDKLQGLISVIDGLGNSLSMAADNCSEILSSKPFSPSGYYWIKGTTGQPQKVYCDMTRSCGNVTGGWMRVAHLNMTDRKHRCPSTLRQRTDFNVRTCAAFNHTATCSSVFYPPYGIKYCKVCGSIRGYHENTMDGFVVAHPDNIDSNYVDGVSLTHGTDPRHHIWTFAVDHLSGYCGHWHAPAFVNRDYFCDIGFNGANIDLMYPLWQSCTRESYCISSHLPWFYKQLPHPTTDDIEMRVCRDEHHSSEDVGIETVEIYVQ